MFDHTDRGHLHVFAYIGLLDLTEDAFVKRAIGLGLPGKLLIANSRFVEGERGLLLLLDRGLQTALGRLRLSQHVL